MRSPTSSTSPNLPEPPPEHRRRARHARRPPLATDTESWHNNRKSLVYRDRQHPKPLFSPSSPSSSSGFSPSSSPTSNLAADWPTAVPPNYVYDPASFPPPRQHRSGLRLREKKISRPHKHIPLDDGFQRPQLATRVPRPSSVPPDDGHNRPEEKPDASPHRDRAQRRPRSTASSRNSATRLHSSSGDLSQPPVSPVSSSPTPPPLPPPRQSFLAFMRTPVGFKDLLTALRFFGLQALARPHGQEIYGKKKFRRVFDPKYAVLWMREYGHFRNLMHLVWGVNGLKAQWDSRNQPRQNKRDRRLGVTQSISWFLSGLFEAIGMMEERRVIRYARDPTRRSRISGRVWKTSSIFWVIALLLDFLIVGMESLEDRRTRRRHDAAGTTTADKKPDRATVAELRRRQRKRHLRTMPNLF